MSKSGYFQLILNQREHDSPDSAEELDGDLVIEEAKEELKLPPMYAVIMLNDDYTPMNFVVEVLIEFFQMSLESATQVMMQVHTDGKAVCGTYPKDIAETKAAHVNRCSRESQHPLVCEVQQVES